MTLINSVRDAIAEAQDPNNHISGERVWSREMAKIITAAGAPETMPAAVKDLLDGLLGQDNLTLYARKRLENVLSQVPAQQTHPTARLGSTHSEFPVHLNKDGWFTTATDSAGKPDMVDLAEAMDRVANLAQWNYELGAVIPGMESLGTGEKNKIVDNLVAQATSVLETNELTGEDGVNFRSACYAVLLYLGRQQMPSGPTAALNDRIHKSLIQLVGREPDKTLARRMSENLTHIDFTQSLTRAQISASHDLFEAKHASRLAPVNVLDYMDDHGYLNWEYVCGKGETFYRSTVGHLFHTKEVHGCRFEKVGGGSDQPYTAFELKFDSPRNANGVEVKGINVSVKKNINHNALMSTGAPTLITGEFHSGFGKELAECARRAQEAGLVADGQPVMFNACGSVDNLVNIAEPLGLRFYPTISSGHIYKNETPENVDDYGENFTGIKRSDGLEAALAYVGGVVDGARESTLRQLVTRKVRHFSHFRNPVFVFHTYRDIMEVRVSHTDSDFDGRVDSLDIYYRTGVEKALERQEGVNPYRFQDNGPADEIRGVPAKNLVHAILDTNTDSHYNASTRRRDGVTHSLVSGGFFDDPADELYKVEEDTGAVGEKIHKISLNSRVAHLTRQEMTALVQYVSSRHFLVDPDPNDPWTRPMIAGFGEADTKLFGLMRVAARMMRDKQSRSTDQVTWNNFLEIMNFPPMPFNSMCSLIDRQHHDYTGNIQVLRDYKGLLSADVIRLLEDPKVGRFSA